MIEGISSEIAAQFWLVAAVFLRLLPAISLAPGYGESFVSARVRLIVTLVLSVAVAPILEPYLPAEAPSPPDILGFVLKETVIGFFLGLVARSIIFLLEMAGAVISQYVSLAQMLGNATEPMPVISHIITTAGLAIIFATSLSDQIIYGFVASYFVDIPGLADLTGYFAAKVSALSNYIFNEGVVIAAGFASLMFVYYLCIGFINKAMPQFMVSFIGIPFVALFSIYFLHEHAELMLTAWQEKALTILKMPFESMQ